MARRSLKDSAAGGRVASAIAAAEGSVPEDPGTTPAGDAGSAPPPSDPQTGDTPRKRGRPKGSTNRKKSPGVEMPDEVRAMLNSPFADALLAGLYGTPLCMMAEVAGEPSAVPSLGV